MVQEYMAHGILNLPLAFFVAMNKAGAKSGTKYLQYKDIMHFEIPLTAAGPPKPP